MTQLNVLLTDNTTVVTVSIPANMATVQPRLFAPDVFLDSIFRRGYFWNPTKTTAYSANQIKSIAYQ